MSKVNSLLSERLKTSIGIPSKMSDLAQLSSTGQLSSFSGVFKISVLSDKEKSILQTFLEEYKEGEGDIQQDFLHLSSLTSELKAINNQASILHGERIKKAQEILKNYKEGAFTFWLIQTYGNRQTPYNFLQYFELHQQLPKALLPKLEEMPRQAAYTLASRNGSLEQKETIIRRYQGETKELLLEQIRKEFPLSIKDKRAKDPNITFIKSLQKLAEFMENNSVSLSTPQKKTVQEILQSLHHNILKEGLVS